MSFIAYEFFRIPNVFGTGASFHLGNTFTALTAMLLDGLSGGLAGAIGLSMADILAGDPGYAVSTFVLKLIIGLVCGFFAHRVFRIKDLSPKSTPRVQYLIRVTGSAMSGLLVNVVTDPVVGYFRDRYLFGQPAEFVKYAVKIAGGVTFVNSMLSTFCAVLLYLALLVLLVWCIRHRQNRAAVFGLLTLAAITANVGLVSLTIFCQARYTIYNMGIFYAALFLLARAFLQGRKSD